MECPHCKSGKIIMIGEYLEPGDYYENHYQCLVCLTFFNKRVHYDGSLTQIYIDLGYQDE